MFCIIITLSGKEIQELLENSVKNNLSKIILTKSLNQLMEQQRDYYIGVGDYERNEKRVSYRNGYYECECKTRAGTLELRVPRTRDGKFSSDIFQRYERTEKALINTILEMYVSGVSTRKVKRITEKLCGFPMSKSFVSSLNYRLSEEVRRREKVIRIFPHVQPATRLIGSVLMEINDEWLSSGIAYIKIKKRMIK